MIYNEHIENILSNPATEGGALLDTRVQKLYSVINDRLNFVFFRSKKQSAEVNEEQRAKKGSVDEKEKEPVEMKTVGEKEKETTFVSPTAEEIKQLCEAPKPGEVKKKE